MLNGNTSSSFVHNHQVGAHLGGFTIEWERPFLSYHLIDKGIHEYASHAMLVLVTEQSGDGGRVKGFSGFPCQSQL